MTQTKDDRPLEDQILEGRRCHIRSKFSKGKFAVCVCGVPRIENTKHTIKRFEPSDFCQEHGVPVCESCLILVRGRR